MKTHVTTTTPDASLGEAVDLMDLYQTPGLPVVDSERRLCGILTESDVLRAMQDTHRDSEGNALQGRKKTVLNSAAMLPLSTLSMLHAQAAAQRSVAECMTRDVISVSEHCDAREAAELLLLHKLRRLPVTDDLGRVIGMLNRIDVLQAVFESLF